MENFPALAVVAYTVYIYKRNIKLFSNSNPNTSQSLTTSRMLGSQYPAQKTICYVFNDVMTYVYSSILASKLNHFSFYNFCLCFSSSWLLSLWNGGSGLNNFEKLSSLFKHNFFVLIRLNFLIHLLSSSPVLQLFYRPQSFWPRTTWPSNMCLTLDLIDFGVEQCCGFLR